MNILVTGGAGFIGSHVARALVDSKEGHNVTVVDDLSYGHEEYVPEGATFIRKSITDPTIEETVKNGKFDLIYHFAAQKNVRASINDPVFDAEQNIIGLLRIMEAARKYGTQSVVFMSSGGAVYGEQLNRPTPETTPALPISPYAISKATGEQYLSYYANAYGMTCVSLRLANVYGPHQDPKGEAGVIAIFISALLEGKQLTVFGDGEQNRDYIYVADVVSACLAVKEHLDEDISGEYNIGTGIETTVNELVAVSAKTLNIEADVKHDDPIPGEVRNSSIDSSLFSKRFDWKPETSLEQGIQKTADWFKDL